MISIYDEVRWLYELLCQTCTVADGLCDICYVTNNKDRVLEAVKDITLEDTANER